MGQIKISILEDEGIVAAQLTKNLEDLGYQVVSLSASGDDALKEAEIHHPDLVLMDINLQRQMNGIDTALELRSRYGIPVIYLTSCEDDITLKQMKDHEPTGYILKPIVVRELQSIIEVTLHKHRHERLMKMNDTSSLRTVVMSAGTGILVTDTNGNIILSNHSLHKILGYVPSDLEQLPFSSLIHPEALSEYLTQSQHFWNGIECNIKQEVRLIHKNGKTVWAHLSANMIDTDEHLPAHVVIIINDISSRIEAEEAYHKLIDQSPLGIIILQDERIVFSNPRICELSGYSCEELVALSPKQAKDLIDPEDREWVIREHRNRMQGKSAKSSYEYRIVRKDQSKYWTNVTISKTTYKGRPAVLAYYQDVHDQKMLENQIRRGKTEWEATVDAVSDILMLTDTEDVILRCNHAATGRFKSDFINIIGKTTGELFPKTIPADGKLLHFNGKHYIEELNGWFDIASYPMELNHTLTGTVYLLKDITHEKELEAALFANQRLTSLGTLAAGLAHEMNSPLQVITSISESLLKQIDNGEMIEPERLRYYMQNVNRNAWRNADIVRALRQYANAPMEDIVEVDINRVILETLPLLKKRHNLPPHISFSTQLSDDLPSLYCSRENISVALINLMTNSIESMPDGGEICICTRLETGAERIVLQIKDQGIGIPKDIQSKIFDPFYSTKPVGSGPGLGLSTTLGIIKTCGGEIGLESSSDTGTKITLYLPTSPPLFEENETTGNDGHDLLAMRSQINSR